MGPTRQLTPLVNLSLTCLLQSRYGTTGDGSPGGCTAVEQHCTGGAAQPEGGRRPRLGSGTWREGEDRACIHGEGKVTLPCSTPSSLDPARRGRAARRGEDRTIHLGLAGLACGGRRGRASVGMFGWGRDSWLTGEEHATTPSRFLVSLRRGQEQ
jgi:hypothetical protein